MQQPQQHVERVGQHPLGHRPSRPSKPTLDHFYVKAAKLIPGEIVKHPGRVGKAVFRQRIGYLLRYGGQAAQDPRILDH